MLCVCGESRSVSVKVIYDEAVFIKAVYGRSLVSPTYSV